MRSARRGEKHCTQWMCQKKTSHDYRLLSSMTFSPLSQTVFIPCPGLPCVCVWVSMCMCTPVLACTEQKIVILQVLHCMTILCQTDITTAYIWVPYCVPKRIKVHKGFNCAHLHLYYRALAHSYTFSNLRTRIEECCHKLSSTLALLFYVLLITICFVCQI